MTVAEQLFGIVGMALDREVPPGPFRWVFYPRQMGHQFTHPARYALSLVEIADVKGLHRIVNHGPNTYILTLYGGAVTPFKCFPHPYPEEDVIVQIPLTHVVTREIRGAIRSRLSV